MLEALAPPRLFGTTLGGPRPPHNKITNNSKNPSKHGGLGTGRWPPRGTTWDPRGMHVPIDAFVGCAAVKHRPVQFALVWSSLPDRHSRTEKTIVKPKFWSRDRLVGQVAVVIKPLSHRNAV